MSLTVQVITIGDELLNGFTIDTNSAAVGQALLKIGLPVSSKITLPDNKRDIVSVLQHSLSNHNIIVCIGGLGPTCDDITRDAIAEVLQVEMKYHPDIAKHLQAQFPQKKIDIKNQATIPDTAKYYMNYMGTACALIYEKNNNYLIVMPGVPKECEQFLEKNIVPYLRDKFPSQKIEFRQKLTFNKLSESEINPVIESLLSEYPKIKFGIYPNPGFLCVHMISNFDTKEENILYQQPIKQKLVSAFDSYFMK